MHSKKSIRCTICLSSPHTTKGWWFWWTSHSSVTILYYLENIFGLPPSLSINLAEGPLLSIVEGLYHLLPQSTFLLVEYCLMMEDWNGAEPIIQVTQLMILSLLDEISGTIMQIYKVVQQHIASSLVIKHRLIFSLSKYQCVSVVEQ